MSISVPQKKRGRPATGETPKIGVRLPAPTLAAIEQFAESRGVDRSEALRRLVELGLLFRSQPPAVGATIVHPTYGEGMLTSSGEPAAVYKLEVEWFGDDGGPPSVMSYDVKITPADSGRK